MPLIQLNTIEKTITCLTLQKTNLPIFQAAVGATATDISNVNEWLAILESLVDHSELCDANKKVTNAVKDRVWRGPVTGDSLVVPTTPAYVPPFPLIEDILGKVNSANRRFREGPGYNDDEVGVALGFFSKSPLAPVDPDTLKPTLNAFPAASGAMFSCVVGNRADSDQWRVEILRAGDTTWQNVGTFTGKSADVVISLTTPGQPEQIQIRIHLRKSNAPYGLVSDAVTVTVNP
ncbi:MAG: hypothetical protein ABL999_11300 [Pyrinomonadaceae bacterium]